MSAAALDTLAGPAAIPRSNGELVFAEPWESLAFGLVVGLCETGALQFEEFRQELITQIAAWEYSPRGDWSYYSCWLAALQVVMERRGILTADEIEATTQEILEADGHHGPDGHHHDHAH